MPVERVANPKYLGLCWISIWLSSRYWWTAKKKRRLCLFWYEKKYLERRRLYFASVRWGRQFVAVGLSGHPAYAGHCARIVGLLPNSNTWITKHSVWERYGHWWDWTETRLFIRPFWDSSFISYAPFWDMSGICALEWKRSYCLTVPKVRTNWGKKSIEYSGASSERGLAKDYSKIRRRQSCNLGAVAPPSGGQRNNRMVIYNTFFWGDFQRGTIIFLFHNTQQQLCL
jgi:hypothetical protein